MARVIGIGGVFLRSTDPTALAAWYRDALGVDFHESGPFAILPNAPESYAVLSTFPSDSTYIGDPASQQFMINLLVDDLEGMLERLRSFGAHVEPITDEENGRFSWTVDADGHRVELLEPR